MSKISHFELKEYEGHTELPLKTKLFFHCCRCAFVGNYTFEIAFA